MIRKGFRGLWDRSFATGLVLIISVGIGLVIGCLMAIFGKGLLAIGDFRTHYLVYLLPFLSFVGLFIVWLYQRFGRNAGKGMGLLFAVEMEEIDSIPISLVPLVMVTTWLTHVFGGSAGREGVAVQIGATLSHAIGRFLPIKDASRLFLIIGMAAGFSGLFQTPLAAIFFALEVLVVGRLYLPALLPATVAAFVASGTSHYLGLEKFSHLISNSLTLDAQTLVKLIGVGVVFGLVGNGFAYSLAYAKRQSSRLFQNPYQRIFIGGLCLSFLLFSCQYGRYTGLGTQLISLAFSGGEIVSYDWLLKLLLTVFTLAIGFQGGEVTPLFAIGATLGVALANLVGLPAEWLAAAGYMAVFGSATNTLLAPLLIGCDVFGYHHLPSFFLVMLVAYAVDTRTSIYAGQNHLFGKRSGFY